MTLQAFFAAHPRAALAFSGGTDSALLLWAAKQYGCDVHAYYVHTAFQPAFELADAARLAAELDLPLTVVEVDILACCAVSGNPADRCYHCKKVLFTRLWEAARQDGHTLLLDGTNASDDASDRPGMRALTELQVLSPLRECGITKAEVRRRSKEAGLFTWDKPAYACLATRIPTGVALTADALRQIEGAENVLTHMGFTDLRVRVLGEAARLQLPEDQLGRLLARRAEVLTALAPYFSPILLDLESR